MDRVCDTGFFSASSNSSGSSSWTNDTKWKYKKFPKRILTCPEDLELQNEVDQLDIGLKNLEEGKLDDALQTLMEVSDIKGVNMRMESYEMLKAGPSEFKGSLSDFFGGSFDSLCTSPRGDFKFSVSKEFKYAYTEEELDKMLSELRVPKKPSLGPDQSFDSYSSEEFCNAIGPSQTEEKRMKPKEPEEQMKEEDDTCFITKEEMEEQTVFHLTNRIVSLKMNHDDRMTANDLENLVPFEKNRILYCRKYRQQRFTNFEVRNFVGAFANHRMAFWRKSKFNLLETAYSVLLAIYDDVLGPEVAYLASFQDNDNFRDIEFRVLAARAQMVDVQPPPIGYVRDGDLFVITYVYVVFGAITLFLNIPLATYLLKTTGKNQKELIVIIALSISDTVCAAQFLAMGIYRFFVWFNEVFFVSQAACNRNIIVASYQVCIQKFQRITANSVLSKGMRHLTKTVAYITLASFFLVLIPEIWFYFNLFGGMNASIYFSCILVKKIVSFFIHTIRHRELMKHVEKFLPRKLTNIMHLDAQSQSAVSKGKSIREFSNQMVTVMR
ncbi:unnamed protein product [Caenorhabditis sp. 36 PRJEB53466]|nr:unnamed protein product [Caenorhabditis sp. 36 PRJEB53466]